MAKKPIDPDPDKLKGMGEICRFTRRSEATIIKFIEVAGFPARKNMGIWESSREEITKWNQRMAASGAVRMVGEA